MISNLSNVFSPISCFHICSFLKFVLRTNEGPCLRSQYLFALLTANVICQRTFRVDQRQFLDFWLKVRRARHLVIHPLWMVSFFHRVWSCTSFSRYSLVSLRRVLKMSCLPTVFEKRLSAFITVQKKTKQKKGHLSTLHVFGSAQPVKSIYKRVNCCCYWISCCCGDTRFIAGGNGSLSTSASSAIRRCRCGDTWCIAGGNGSLSSPRRKERFNCLLEDVAAATHNSSLAAMILSSATTGCRHPDRATALLFSCRC